MHKLFCREFALGKLPKWLSRESPALQCLQFGMSIANLDGRSLELAALYFGLQICSDGAFASSYMSF